jgi:hypothetical protein
MRTIRQEIRRSIWPLLSSVFYQFQSLFSGASQYRTVTYLYDRPLENGGMVQYMTKHLFIGCISRDADLLYGRFSFAKDVEGPKPGLSQQVLKLCFADRVTKVIDLVKLYAVFTKQRCQIAARRSGRFLVNCDLHKLSSFYQSSRPLDHFHQLT